MKSAVAKAIEQMMVEPGDDCSLEKINFQALSATPGFPAPSCSHALEWLCANDLHPALNAALSSFFSCLRTAVGIFRCPAWDCTDNIPSGLICF